MGKEHFVKQDSSSLWHNAAALAADTDSAVEDFGTPGGCAAHHRVLDVTTLATGESLAWIFKQSDASGSGYTEVARINITANGRYALPIDNTLVEKRYFKTTKDITVATAGTITVTEFSHTRLNNP